MEQLLIRASSASKIMAEPKAKADKEAGKLGKTAESYIRELWLQQKYGYKEVMVIDEIMKGWLCEQDSMTLTQNVLGGQLRIKNVSFFKNDFFCGTPDVILSDVIEDVKSSWSLKTFMNAELEDNYWWQGQVYMDLVGIKKYRLIYCLNNTPEHLVTNEKQRYFYKFQCDEENPMLKTIYEQIELNHNVGKIPEKDRIKVFEFNYDPEAIAKLKEQVLKARLYFNSLSLNK